MTSRRRSLTVLLLAGLSASLGGCLTHTRDTDGITASIPTDYRERHPIVIEEANKSVEVFVGSGRGGLSATQHAD
ncbi:pilus assembly protein CpaD, partial [Lactobacillus crispatus]